MVRGIEKLFEPIMIGNLELKNRIKMPAMAVAMGVEEGISEQIKAFYAERARGGVALIGISCAPTRLIDDPMLGVYDDKFIPGLKDLSTVIHENGAHCYAQMGVGYSWAFGDGPVELVGPSGYTATGKKGSPFRMGGPYEPMQPRALSIDEIKQIVSGYGDGARRIKEAGFDAVEVIGSVGYIIAQFISPLTNKRTDEYGGSLKNRMRLFLEIIEDIKNKTGGNFPVTVRISGADLLDGIKAKGYTLKDTMEMSKMLEAAGVNEIDVMAGWHNASVAMIQTQTPQGNWVYLAEGVKSAVSIPVAAGTNIQDIKVAAKTVADGKSDMVYMARALIADPELPNKAKEKRFQDIRPCINCCRCIEASDSPPVYCSVNPRVGRESEFPKVKPAEQKKRVLVIGGGPGGMEAARIASLRGHDVILAEQNAMLGGALLMASIANHRLGALLRHKVKELGKVSVSIELNTKVTPEYVSAKNPDIIISAVGGSTHLPQVPGVESDVVVGRKDIEAIFSGGSSDKGGPFYKLMSKMGSVFVKIYFNPDLLRIMMWLPFPFKKKVVILGGNFAGLEMGEMLVEHGKQVTILEEGNRIGTDVGITHRWVFLSILKAHGAKILKNVEILEIGKKGVRISIDGKEETIPADNVIPTIIKESHGGEENGQPMLVDQLMQSGKEVLLIGDCQEPGKIMEAITTGFLTANKI